jgi:hypothetical protein
MRDLDDNPLSYSRIRDPQRATEVDNDGTDASVVGVSDTAPCAVAA